MIVSLIVAVSKNFAIGVNNQLPWHLPADLKYFKQLTSGHAIIMGSNTYKSIGKPLPNRRNIVVTSQKNPDWMNEQLFIVHSLEEGINKARLSGETECFIIGGANIYKQSMNLCDKIYLTEIDTEIENADAYFPEITSTNWKIVNEEKHNSDEKNKWNYIFKTFEKL